MTKKILALIVVLVTVCAIFAIPAYASEEEVETPNTELHVPAYAVTIRYTEDSSAFKGITYETYIDPVTLTVCFKIVKELPIGNVIYDVPETPYIDGIRVNGNTVDSLIIPVTEGTTYEVAVRMVYEDNLLGDVAKIIDGTFDFRTLLENPVLLLAGLYYVLSILSLVGAAFMASFSKKAKVKTADDIAAKVDESSNRAIDKVKTEVTEIVLAECTPILQRILDDFQNVIKAVVLSKSKDKEAQLALLETLQKSADASNLNSLIDSIKQSVSDSIDKNAETRLANAEALRNIASKVVDTALTVAVDKAEDAIADSFKSVF